MARSSAVSSKGGLRKGGSSSLPSFMALIEVLIVISWMGKVQSSLTCMRYRLKVKHLSTFIDEEKDDGLVLIFGDGRDLSGDPGEFLVREPDLCPLAVYVFRHDDGCPVGLEWGRGGLVLRREEEDWKP